MEGRASGHGSGATVAVPGGLASIWGDRGWHSGVLGVTQVLL